MTYARLFSKSRRADFRREVPWTVLYFLCCFFVIPVSYLFGLEMLTHDTAWAAADAAQRYDRLYNYAVEVLGVSPFLLLMMCVFGMLEAYHSFGYLHRKRELDFYHGLPQTRRQIFFGRFRNGIAAVAVPYLICLAAGMLCAAVSGLPVKDILQPLLAAALLLLLVFLLFYTVSILAVMLTGRALTGVLGACVLAGYFPILGLLLTEIPSIWFRTYYDGNAAGTDFLNTVGNLSPVYQAVKFIRVYGMYYTRPADPSAVTCGFLLRVLLCFAAACAMTVLCVHLYEKRALERAGDGMAFPKTEGVIRVLLTGLAGLAALQFFRSLDRGYAWIVFFTVAAILLTHMLVELIYRADPKKIFGHGAELITACVIGVLAVTALRFDWFGYDSYLPEESSIASASLVTYEGDGRRVWAVSSDGTESALFYMEDKDENAAALSGEAASAVRRIAEEGIKEAAARRAEGSFSSGIGNVLTDAERETADRDLHTMTVFWEKENGSRVSRTYRVPLSDVKDAYKTVFDDPAYREQMYPVLAASQDMLTGELALMDGINETEIPAEKGKEVLSVYLSELRNVSFAEIGDAYPDAVLKIYVTEAYCLAAGYEDGLLPEWKRYYVECPVYACFTETGTALARLGISAGRGEAALDKYPAIRCYHYDASEDAYTEITFTEEEDLALIRKNLVMSDYTIYNIYGMPLLCGGDGSQIAFIAGNEDIDGITGFVPDNAETRALFKTGGGRS